MKIILNSRHHGVHSHVRETEIPGQFIDYARNGNPEGRRPWDECLAFDEDKLITALPDGFLPVPPDRILLTVGKEWGSTGQSQLTRFRPWAKYFDAYVVELMMDGSETPLRTSGSVVPGS
jgi:hypothetical protein